MESTCFALSGPASGIAIDSGGLVIIVGATQSNELPLVNPVQRDNSGFLDAYLMKLATLSLDSVVDAAGYGTGAVAPGAIVALFGSGLAYAEEAASGMPLPLTLLDTSVTVNGVPAPLYFVSPSQINAQLPFETQPGSAVVDVVSGGAGVSRRVQVFEHGGGILAVNARGTGAGVVVHGSDFSLVTAANPADPGEVISVFATGLGLLNPSIATGVPVTDPPPQTTVTPDVRIAGRLANVRWSGAAPGYVGLYQVNVEVPSETPGGDQPIQIYSGNTVTIAIR
jgi:uncharacterized protein (TIGR03437 family)